MMTILIKITFYIVMAVPTVSEALWIDPAYWANGKSDKPMSTRIRGLLFVLVSVGGAVAYNELTGVSFWLLFLVTALITVNLHIAFFGYLINIKLGQPLDYLGLGDYDKMIRKIPWWVRLLGSLILLTGSIVWFEKLI